MCRFLQVIISVTHLRDKAAMFADKRRFFFSQNLYEKKRFFPAEGNAFVSVHKHGPGVTLAIVCN